MKLLLLAAGNIFAPAEAAPAAEESGKHAIFRLRPMMRGVSLSYDDFPPLPKVANPAKANPLRAAAQAAAFTRGSVREAPKQPARSSERSSTRSHDALAGAADHTLDAPPSLDAALDAAGADADDEPADGADGAAERGDGAAADDDGTGFDEASLAYEHAAAAAAAAATQARKHGLLPTMQTQLLVELAAQLGALNEHAIANERMMRHVIRTSRTPPADALATVSEATPPESEAGAAAGEARAAAGEAGAAAGEAGAAAGAAGEAPSSSCRQRPVAAHIEIAE
jgi:hypothetical protein